MLQLSRMACILRARVCADFFLSQLVSCVYVLLFTCFRFRVFRCQKFCSRTACITSDEADMSWSHTCNVFFFLSLTTFTDTVVYQLFLVAFHCVYDILSSSFTSPCSFSFLFSFFFLLSFSLPLLLGNTQRPCTKALVSEEYSGTQLLGIYLETPMILPSPAHPRGQVTSARGCTSVRTRPRQPIKSGGGTSDDCTAPKAQNAAR